MAQILNEDECANGKNFVAGGDREHKKPVVSCYGCLCKVVGPEKRAQHPARGITMCLGLLLPQAQGNWFGLQGVLESLRRL